jgi:hypothetical protein
MYVFVYKAYALVRTNHLSFVQSRVIAHLPAPEEAVAKHITTLKEMPA